MNGSEEVPSQGGILLNILGVTYFCIYGTISINVIVRYGTCLYKKIMRIKKTCSNVLEDILYN